MKKALIVYYKENEKAKHSNEEKTASELEKLFIEKGFYVKRELIEPSKKFGLKEQFRTEKEMKLKSKPPSIEGFDFVVIGTPIVGSFTSSPIINAFIRSIPKKKAPKKTAFVLFATGIIPGFALKKMQSLLSMNGIKTLDAEAFTSIFEFDDKKLADVRKFFFRVMEKYAQQ